MNDLHITIQCDGYRRGIFAPRRCKRTATYMLTTAHDPTVGICERQVTACCKDHVAMMIAQRHAMIVAADYVQQCEGCLICPLCDDHIHAAAEVALVTQL